MKKTSLRLVLQTAVLAIAFSAAGRAENTATVSKQDLQAKLGYCEVCHGLSGQGFVGYYPIPRLAGQQPEYLKNQLAAFVERRRVNPIMFNVAHVLSPAMQTALAANFSDLNPKPAGAAAKELAAAGGKIFKEGIPGAGIPPCASCHGQEAKGNGEFPRLAGQLYPYIVRQLADWSKERGQDPSKPDSSAMMQPIAHGLTEPQIKAVAAYLSNLE
jgi:cytochrome c553